MAHSIDIGRAQDIIKYHFANSALISHALHAPEKLHDQDTNAVVYENDGNRALAQLGQKVLETFLLDRWLTSGNERSTAIPSANRDMCTNVVIRHRTGNRGRTCRERVPCPYCQNEWS